MMTMVRKELEGAKGLLKNGEEFFLMCGRCGTLTTEAQAIFSVRELGHVECISCQRIFKEMGVHYKTPEHTLNYEKVKRATFPCGCGKVISWKQMMVGYQVAGKAMCKFCLVKNYGVHVDHVAPAAVIAEVGEEVEAFEPEAFEPIFIADPVVEEPKKKGGRPKKKK
jgi:hypothetical protein